ncbi:MAG: hypothetical protein BWK73_05800 [Thiothrix lacustris]|uniref:Uncharacterized protein n=1 Tax=Thiothrix lacustris TaxID=525917 RepID=A0A1Y1QWT8_9GAMM|nr:MAG: hypothetical protein BWK73_05800 [Thiothrix lacustris]
MERHTRYSALSATIRRLVHSPCTREELDTLLGWQNSPEIIRKLRERGVPIETEINDQHRAVYYITAPMKEKAKLYLSAITTITGEKTP